MKEQIAEWVAHSYAIGTIEQVAPVDAGFLSRNFIIETVTGRYFLKQYRFTDMSRVKAAHEAKFFFARAGMPAILPIPDKEQRTIVVHDERFHALFPFVNGHQYRRGDLPLAALESMAQMQARIHRAGAHVDLPPVRRRSVRKSYDEFVETSQRILRSIPGEGKTPFDELALDTLQVKTALAAQHGQAIEQIQLASDHLLHGDFQEANVFFDSCDAVSHVFDWEKAVIEPRGLHLCRAIALICFGQAKTYIADHSEANFRQAQAYLAAYNDVYAIPRDEFLRAARVRYLHKMMSLWVETEHYLRDNERVDLFLEADHSVLLYYADHFDDYAERICGDVLIV